MGRGAYKLDSRHQRLHQMRRVEPPCVGCSRNGDKQGSSGNPLSYSHIRKSRMSSRLGLIGLLTDVQFAYRTCLYMADEIIGQSWMFSVPGIFRRSD